MASNGFAVMLIQGLSRCSDNKLKSGRVYHARLSFVQERAENGMYSKLSVLKQAVPDTGGLRRGNDAEILTLGFSHGTLRKICSVA